MTPSAAGPTRAAIERDLLAWCSARLAPPGVVLTADTPLFASRLVDSIRILELIAWVERAIGTTVPDAAIRMDNFASVRRIAAVFGAHAPAAVATTEGDDARA